MPSPLKILLIGCGKMGGAMFARWQDLSYEIFILDPSHPKGFKDFKSLPQIYFDIIILAVKPQNMDEVCAELVRLEKPSLIVSIAAGKSLKYFNYKIGPDWPVIRAMPNTPASIGKGATVAVKNQNVLSFQKDAAQTLLQKLGSVDWLDDENMMDVVTAVSGSGPAYLYLLIEAMAAAGQSLGLPADLADRLARQTVTGAAALAENEPDAGPSELRKNVTSRGGTTEAALNVLMKDSRFQELIGEAVASAARRSRELN